ncbi:hypothetical protein [Kutzneria sp. CA-103260]|uniref:hypothetical protein n=1 Tax=Kutzneria sp. CA-103260 TaxID=2802641 RepID=UPI001BA9F603|nr:hypothetical protein [Kutzneria sp. CA-103260]QUQ65716.1 hypothetical protein JJ691_34400 [Kutzneria sp. CA-103260]
MSDLLDLVLEAHGGLDRWRRVQQVRARLDLTGPTFVALGQGTTLVGVDVEVHVHEQCTVFAGFTGPGRRGVYTPDLVTVTEADGTVLAQRGAPRESYPLGDADAGWDALHALYFAGYGLWNYLTTPYLLTLPGMRTEELEPSEVDGWSLRRLRVTFPPHIATHSTEQVFYFGEDGLLRRIDYAPYVFGGRPGAHHIDAHETVSGLVFPTHRHVRTAVGGRVGAEAIITLDLADISVAFAD